MLSYYGQLFVLVVLLVSCARVFYIEKMEYDLFSSLIAVAGVALVLCVAAWNLSFSLLITIALFLVVFFLNFQAIFSFFSGLKVFGYSKFHTIASYALIPVLLFFIVASFYFRPVRPVSTKHENAASSRTKPLFYSGSINSGFVLCKNLFSYLNYNLKVSVFLPAKTSPNGSNLPLILFVPDAHSSIQDYEPFLLAIAAEGYEVRAADFYTDETQFFDFPWMNHRFFRTFFLRSISIFFPQNEQNPAGNDFALQIMRKEYLSLLELDGIKAGINERKIYLFFDSPNAIFQANVIENFNMRITGTANVQVGPKAGFGCLEQVDPFVASFFGAKRDPSYSAVKKAVLVTREQMGKR